MEEIKVRAVVCLPSNRTTPMTVESIDGDVATCVWLDSKQKSYREGFRIAALEIYDDEPLGGFSA